MAQKSLPILNKVNTSMIWYSTYYYRYYKWMSSQNLYLLYFFNKLFIYLDFFFFKLMWVKPYLTNLYSEPTVPVFSKFVKIKFFKPVTAYLVNFNTKNLIINMYYKSSLARFQEISATYEEELYPESLEALVQSNFSRLFFL